MAYGYRRRYRRRRNSYRRKRRNRQMRFRTGQINAAGGRPVTPHSRTVATVTAGNLLCTGTTCGDNAAFNIVDWSAPADPEVSTFSIGGTANNHPSGHVEIVADGYDRVQVLNALYRFNVRFKGDDNEAQDYIFAYRFSNNSAAILTHTAGTVGIDNWKDMRQSRGWAYKRLSATHSGGSQHPSTMQINVRIPNVKRLTQKLTSHTSADYTANDYRHAISDAAASADQFAFLHITVFTIDGVALAAGDIQIDVDVFQRVKVWKTISETEIEPADQES